MTERSSSGVRNLRAMFEAKDESTSPPSRGRSPAGSEGVRSASSRPISKVRTSFVVVERSGQMGPQLGMRKESGAGNSDYAVDGVNETVPEEQEQPLNGAAKYAPSADAPKVHRKGVGKEEEENRESRKTFHTLSKTNGEAPSPTLKDDNGKMPNKPSVPLATETSETAPPASSHDLGSVLKGSPFEEAAELRPGASMSSKPSSPPSSKTKPADGKANGKASTKAAIQPKPKTDSKKAHTISTAKANSSPRPTADSKSQGGPDEVAKSPRTPVTSSNPHKPISKPSAPQRTTPKVTSPRVPSLSKGPPKPAAKEPILDIGRKPNGTSKPANGSGLRGSKTAASKPIVPVNKKSAPTSPVSKNRPKSPTRPARVPAAATASTAASTAKHEDHPADSSKRTSISNSKTNKKASGSTKERPSTHHHIPASTKTAELRRKSSRPSLPAGSQAAQRPKSRTSTVGSKAPDEGFLARMMRPTASSTSKTHEKIEPKSPPRNHNPIKARRVNGGGEETKDKPAAEPDYDPSEKRAEAAAETMSGDLNAAADEAPPLPNGKANSAAISSEQEQTF
ncbi:hypothetical protein MMC09_007060 [Bachmanniomyces sp. S44760]|nr:hypothetical protein [Bachmanniomyces sp. S44760]